MFIAVQFPFADLRKFLPCDTFLVAPLDWPLPKKIAFLRYAGPSAERLRGGVPEWDAEEVFYSMARGLRLPSLETTTFSLQSTSFRTECKFRRLFFDGSVVGRAEIGFRLLSRDQTSPAVTDLHEFDRLLQSILEIRVAVPTTRPPHKPFALGRAAEPIARVFLNATSRQRTAPEPWWVASGDPQIIVALPAQFAGVPIPRERQLSLNAEGVRLSHLWLRSGATRIGVWLIRNTDLHGDSSLDISRRLRICLLRLHSEREALKNVIRAISGSRIPVTPRHESTECLQNYLNRATSELSHERFGLPTTKILDHAWNATDFALPGQAATLVANLGNCRRQVEAKVRTFIARESLGRRKVMQVAGNLFVNQLIAGDKVDQRQTFGPNAHIGVNIQAGTVRESSHLTMKHVVLRDLEELRPEGDGQKATPLAMAPSPLTVEKLTLRGAAEVARAAGVRAIAPVIPMRLIAPVAVREETIPPVKGDTWGVKAVGADTSPFTGEGVTVAVLDTGIDETHPAFANIKLIRRNFTNEPDEDLHGHGTHCAGTVFGRSVDGARLGVALGVTTALIGKVLGHGGGGSDVVLEAILWALQQGAHVISMSLGIDFPGYVALLEKEGLPTQVATSRALEAYRANVLLFERLASLIEARCALMQPCVVIAAAGNESQNPDFPIGVCPPAVANGIVSVAAIASEPDGFVVAPFSNVGARLAAPGVDVLSAKRGGGFAVMSGTSMATPHVAGVAALWAEKLAKANRLSGQLLMNCLMGSATLTCLKPGFSPGDVGAGIVRAPQETGDA